MSTPQLRDDEVLEQVLEDDRAAAVQKFREQEEITADAIELTDA
jgi:predicted transcriptional regulator